MGEWDAQFQALQLSFLPPPRAKNLVKAALIFISQPLRAWLVASPEQNEAAAFQRESTAIFTTFKSSCFSSASPL